MICVHCVVCAYSKRISYIQLILIVTIPDFTMAARLEVENGRISLVHDGNKFIRYGSNENTRYWRCRQSFKYECKARILTKLVNGREMLQIRNDAHDHKKLRGIKRSPK